MMFVQRNDQGQIVACFVNPQEFAAEEVADDAPDLLAFLAPPVPMVVSRAQGEIALHRASLLAQVEAFIAGASTDTEIRIWWQRAQEFRRDSATLLAVATAMEWSPQQLDDLFILASEIQA